MPKQTTQLSSATDIKLTSSTVSILDPVSADQVRLMRWALQCLIEKYRTLDGRQRPVEWCEWKLFLLAGYVCGFVCNDSDAEEGHTVFRKVLHISSCGEQLSIRQLRALFHYIIRSERWGDMGGDRGGHTLWAFLESDASEAVRKRLSEV